LRQEAHSIARDTVCELQTLRQEAHSIALVGLAVRQGGCLSQALERVSLPVDVLEEILLELVLLNDLDVLLRYQDIEFLLELADLMGSLLAIKEPVSALN